MTIGIVHLALGAGVDLGHLGDDLVVGGEDEPVELDLAHRPVAAHGQADGGAEDAGLGERGVDDAVLAEVLLQAVGDPEDPAELADVLAHEHDLGVVLHGLAQAEVERLADGERLGAISARPPRSSRGTRRTRPRCAASGGVCSA